MSLSKIAGKNAREQRARIKKLSESGKQKNKNGLEKTDYWRRVDAVAGRQKVNDLGRGGNQFEKDTGRGDYHRNQYDAEKGKSSFKDFVRVNRNSYPSESMVELARDKKIEDSISRVADAEKIVKEAEKSKLYGRLGMAAVGLGATAGLGTLGYEYYKGQQ